VYGHTQSRDSIIATGLVYLVIITTFSAEYSYTSEIHVARIGGMKPERLSALRQVRGTQPLDIAGKWRQHPNTLATICVTVLVGNPEGERVLGRPRRRWENNIRMDLECEGVYVIHPAQASCCEQGNEPSGPNC
jgi:hypothetical protein